MAEITNQLITKMLGGSPIRVYINPTINADGTITLGAGGILDSVAHANAKEIGYTQGGFELTRGIEVMGVPTDQTLEDVLQSLSSQDVHLKTSVLQIRDYAHLVLLNPGMAAMTGTGFTGISDSTTRTITTASVACVQKLPNSAFFKVIIAYACYNVAPYNEKMAKEYNVTALDLKVVNAGRVDGRTFASYETTA
jgi:hypothetical protein